MFHIEATRVLLPERKDFVSYVFFECSENGNFNLICVQKVRLRLQSIYQLDIRLQSMLRLFVVADGELHQIEGHEDAESN